MSMGNKISSEVIAWGTVAMVIVIISVILLKTRSVNTIACSSGYILNSSADSCCLGSTLTTAGCATGNATAVTTQYTTAGTFVTALAEPANWVIIIVISIIGIGLIAYFRKGMKN